MATPDDLSRARAVLIRAEGWSLPETRWVPVLEAVRTLRRAVDSADLESVRHAANLLEHSGPRLANRPDEEEIPVPSQVRDEIIVVLQSLRTASAMVDE